MMAQGMPEPRKSHEPKMLYGNYTFACRFETEAVLPPYKGSTFRGAFGHALKRIVCALRRQDCPDCLLRDRCLYTQVFETELSPVSGDNRRVSADPHPFVIEPPPESKTVYNAGERFECGLLLFGEINKSLPYFVYAFERMGEFGLGKKGADQRGSFTLVSVSCDGETIYSEDDRILKTADVAREISLTDCAENIRLAEEDRTPQRVKVILETPVRFKSNGRLRDSLPFEVLVRLMLRRISSLMNAFGDGEPPLDYPALVERGRSVRTLKSDLRWFDWRRFSNRQGVGMQMGGLVGEVTYEGKLKDFMPLLYFCSEVHVGKQTSFGLGKIRLTASKQREQTL